MFLFLFYAAKVRRKFKPRKKLFHPVTTLFHYATTLSTKYKKKRPPEGNLFLILQYTTHFVKLSDSTTHFGKLSEFDKVYIINYALRTLANFQSLPKFFYPSIQNSPTCPTRLTRPTLEPVQKVFKGTTSASPPLLKEVRELAQRSMC